MPHRSAWHYALFLIRSRSERDIAIDIHKPDTGETLRRLPTGAKILRVILVFGNQHIGSAMYLTAVFQKVAEGYIGFVEELPGANTQGATLEEVRANLAEAVDLVLEANRVLAEESILGKDVIRERLLLPAA
jgi:predicted RNase H-like HicB family nuclease